MNKNYKKDVLSDIKEIIGDMSNKSLSSIDDDTNLVSDKIIDSFGVIHLILKIEEKYGINFNENDLLSDGLLTPKKLCLIVTTKIKDGR